MKNERHNLPEKPVLYIFSGLPGVGKSTLAKELSKKAEAVYLRIDTIEQGLRDICGIKVEGEGYRLAYRIAEDNIKTGQSVVADCVNPWKLTREEWKETAVSHNAAYINIEIVCKEKEEHKRRAENRVPEVKNLQLPSWNKIQNLKYEQWEDSVITVDTGGKTIEESLDELILKINKWTGETK
jgi:predicted kinase